jgi:hypothetical protein
LALAAVLIYYGGTSEVAWLFLLGYWVVAMVVAAYIYARWNWTGLHADYGVKGVRHGPDSPWSELPEAVLRSAPDPVIFERDHVTMQLALRSRGAARGPARIKGFIEGTELSVAAGLVPKRGWMEEAEVGPIGRGPIQAKSWLLEATDPLGLFRFRRKDPDSEAELALPLFASLARRTQVRELEASVAAPRAGSGTEMFGVREYRPGDPLRRIHWRSSARHGELIVREFEPPGVQTLGIFCDPSPPTPEAADQIARIAASEAWDCLRAGGRVVLWSPGAEPSRPEHARSLWPLLEWLARYPYAADLTAPLSPRVGDAIAVTASPDADIDDALDTIRLRGGTVRAWVVGEADLEVVDVPVQRAGLEWPLP